MSNVTSSYPIKDRKIIDSFNTNGKMNVDLKGLRQNWLTNHVER